MAVGHITESEGIVNTDEEVADQYNQPCARYFGSDGTLCSTHNGRFATPSEMRCDRRLGSSPDPDLLRAHLRSTSRVAHNAMHHDRIDGTWETCQHEPCVGDRRVLDRRLSRFGSSPDLTGLDPLTLAAAMPGLSFDYDGHRVYLALYQPDLTGDAIVSAEMGYWLRAARALAARLSPAPETDPSQVER